MVTKEELSEEINEALGTDIEWDRLLEEDIRHFHGIVEDGGLVEPQMKQFAKKYGKEALDDQIDEWYPGKIIGRII